MREKKGVPRRRSAKRLTPTTEGRIEGLACCEILMRNGLSKEEKERLFPLRDRLRDLVRRSFRSTVDWEPLVTARRFELEQSRADTRAFLKERFGVKV